MEWKKRNLSTRTLEITRTDDEGNITKWHAPHGDSLSQRRAIELDITDKDREISVIPHEIEHYTVTLKYECPRGTLGIISDELAIGVSDGIEVRYIRRTSFEENEDVNDIFLFERNKLTGYEGRSTKDYEITPDEVIVTELPGFTNGILDDRESVLDPNLNHHYESFKQLRPDIFQSLEACLNELRG